MFFDILEMIILKSPKWVKRFCKLIHRNAIFFQILTRYYFLTPCCVFIVGLSFFSFFFRLQL